MPDVPRHIYQLTLIALLCHSVLGAQTEQKHKFPPIVFDDWWNVDYVKSGCALYKSEGNPCPVSTTPEDVVREFENEIEVAFASESTCHGLSLLHLTPEMVNEAVRILPLLLPVRWQKYLASIGS